MKTDRYLRVVLTVIAVCLVMLTLQNMNLIPKAQAEGPLPPISNYALVPLSEDGTVQVKIKSINDVLDVNIQKVGGNNCYQGVPIVEKK